MIHETHHVHFRRFLATLYTLDIMLASWVVRCTFSVNWRQYIDTLLRVLKAVRQTATLLEEFIDPYVLTSRLQTTWFSETHHPYSIAAILTCRFMLLLRQFDSTLTDTTASGHGTGVREHMASTVLQFGAQPSYSLPAMIASFANPVHVDPDKGLDIDAIFDNRIEVQEPDATVPAPEGIVLL